MLLNTVTMKTQEFIDVLQAHPEKELVFEYDNGQRVGANYHITEVKNIRVDSVDCGARTDSWNETVIQLWESPSELGKRHYLSVYKALGILRKVEKMRPMDHSAVLKFEYGNEHFHTSHLLPDAAVVIDNQLVVPLRVQPTQCKAREIRETSMAGRSPAIGCC